MNDAPIADNNRYELGLGESPIGNIFMLTINGDEGCRVRIRPSGEVEYSGDFTEATRAFYDTFATTVEAAQSLELRQLREEVAAFRAALTEKKDGR